VVVVKQDAGLGIDGHINIGPAIVIEIVRDGGDGVARAGFEDAGFSGDISKSAVAIVVIEDVGVAGRPRGPHITGMPFHWQTAGSPGWSLRGIELDVIADEQIEMAVAVVIEEGAARAPADAVHRRGRPCA
jgi:hypothetical protein